MDDLKKRLRNWSASQCIGEVFIKFSTKLVAYMNYISRWGQITNHQHSIACYLTSAYRLLYSLLMRGALVD